MSLFNSELSYAGRESNISEEQVRELFGSAYSNFESFIKLYLTYDGVSFTKQAMMFRNKFYEVPKGEWDKIDIGFFLRFDHIIEIRDIKKKNFPELELFVLTHIPFADDGCGNSVWIEISTGHIKVLYHEYEFEEGLIIVAPSFDDFCSSLENWKM
jgi:hypothetical protein